MNTRRSTIVPYKAVLTEKNLADQSGKVRFSQGLAPPLGQYLMSLVIYLTTPQVFLVTGASGGLGKLLANILYQHNAKVCWEIASHC